MSNEQQGRPGAMKPFERLESEVRGYSRSFPKVFANAQGALLYDETGRAYIDFLSGAGSLNYGHNNPHLKSSIVRYLDHDGLVHGLDMASTAKRAFLESFREIILKPREFDYKIQFTGPTGTNAVEAAFKLARKVTGRTAIVSFTNGFHGVSLGSLAATGNSHFRNAAGVPLQNTVFMPYDGYLGSGLDTLDYFEKAIQDRSSGLDLPAAAIVETVQGEGGVNVAGFKWLKRLERICTQYGILLIVDDIQVGCGRTGTFFSFEPAGISPDIITLSKSISAFGLPMAIVLMRPELDRWKPSEHNGTFRGNNLAFVTATKAIEMYWRDDRLSNRVVAAGERMRIRLESMCNQFPGMCDRVRGRGLIQGLVFKKPELAATVSRLAFEAGLIIETSGSRSEVLKLLPSLLIDDETLSRGLDLIESAMERASRIQIALEKTAVGA
ncbi:MAG: putative diaminobutyrate--2-oxoglutarate aminotransferase [Candidatus Hydrogenedentota bacterium]